MEPPMQTSSSWSQIAVERLIELANLDASTFDSISQKFDQPSESIGSPETLASAFLTGLESDKNPLGQFVIENILQLADAHLRTDETPAVLTDRQFDRISISERHRDQDLDVVRQGLERLAALASTASVIKTARAIELTYANDNLFQGSRVLTDVRPLFDTEGTSIDGAVVQHTLQLQYRLGGDAQMVEFSLDYSDLQQLARDCVRAMSKDETAHEQLCQPANVPSLRVSKIDHD